MIQQVRNCIEVKNLIKTYQVYDKPTGLLGSLSSLFSRTYRSVHAVSDVSFSLAQGEVVGFIGPNGAGKTTTLKCLSGLLYPTSGTVSVLGYKPWDRKYEFLRQFSIVMGQKNQLWWDLPPIETFELQKDIYGIKEKEYKQSLHMLTDLMDISDVLHVQVRKLSLGQRMKCELVAALLHNPKVLFLDEPTIGLDVTMQVIIRDFLHNYNKETNATIILTSHNMDDVKSLCQRIIVIDHGQLMFDGSLQKIIDTYATHKILTTTFSKEIDIKKVESIGQIKSFDAPIAQIVVPRKIAAAKAGELLTKFPIEDINIEEPSIEVIIRHMFKDHKKFE